VEYRDRANSSGMPLSRILRVDRWAVPLAIVEKWKGGEMRHYRTSTMMRSVLATALFAGVALLVFSCATAPSAPLAPGEVKLIKLDIPREESIIRNLPFVMTIQFEADGKPEIRRACFYWSGDGPYCFKVVDVSYGSPGTIRVEPRAKDSGAYVLEAYVLYIRDGKTQPTKAISTRVLIP
jgi:hypothetical protein